MEYSRGVLVRFATLSAQVSDEHGLQFKSKAAEAGTGEVKIAPSTSGLGEAGEDALEKRLAALRG